MMNSKIVFSLVVAATFALCGTDAISAPKPPLKIVIVGDDTLRTIVLDYSPVPCGPSPYPTPCYYEAGSAAAYPGILGSISASEVTALSPLGSASGTDPTARPIPVVLESQVPQIASDADVVFVNVGASEVAAGSATEALGQLQKLAAGIRARAPRARIVFLGLRETPTVAASAISAWNSRVRSIATGIGATFVDMRTLFPLTDYPDFPDSFHPSVNGSKRIAETLAAALPGAKKTSALTTAKTSSLDSRDSGAPPSVSPSGLPSLPSRKTRLNIAVIGSSMERNVVLDGSSIPCGIIMRAAPCLYEDLSPLSYPTFLGALTNATIYNLSVAGSQAADNKTAGTIPPALDTQVPNIPANVDIVILQIGLNDTSISATIEVTLNRVNKVVAAVRARAPNARIIFVSLRDYGASFHQRITDWNAREMRVARSIGATVVDIRTPFPATDYTDFPDGTHASVIGGLRVAQLIEAAIDKMRVPAQPSK